MKYLIINPKKLSYNKKDINFFLGEWFINFINKSKINKIKYDFIKKKKINIKKQVLHIKYSKKIYKKILFELYPRLNEISKINWSYKSWDFLLGVWLHSYIAILFDRINIIKPILNLKNLNLEKIIKLGKKVSLATYDLRDFTFQAGLIDWNEKLLSRIIYLKKTKKFNNSSNLLNSEKTLKNKNNQTYKIFFYKIFILFIKYIERLVCFNNKVIFYNTYIKDKLKLIKINLRLKNLPFKHSYNFFNDNLLKKNFNSFLRKKNFSNFSSKNSDLKLIKFLIAEMMPTIYLEGFKEQLNIARNSHLPKRIDKIFTSSAYTDNAFKFWVADQINKNTKIFFGQHGGGYNIFKNWFGDDLENNISNKRFVWGSRVNNSKQISVGNYLINPKEFKTSFNYNSKKYLLILPTVEIYKRNRNLNPADYFNDDVSETQKIIDNVILEKSEQLNIRPHPQNKRRELNFENFLRLKQKNFLIDSKTNFQKNCNDHSLLIFTYLSTEFFKQITIGKPCLLLLNKYILKDYMVPKVKKDFDELLKVGILFTDGKKIANKINSISNDIKSWWLNKEIVKTRKKFCYLYSDYEFNENLIIKNLLN